jgi:hypothetical protein
LYSFCRAIAITNPIAVPKEILRKAGVTSLILRKKELFWVRMLLRDDVVGRVNVGLNPIL